MHCQSLEKMPSVVDVLTGQIQLTDTEVRLPQSLVRGVQDDLEGEVRGGRTHELRELVLGRDLVDVLEDRHPGAA